MAINGLPTDSATRPDRPAGRRRPGSGKGGMEFAKNTRNAPRRPGPKIRAPDPKPDNLAAPPGPPFWPLGGVQ